MFGMLVSKLGIIRVNSELGSRKGKEKAHVRTRRKISGYRIRHADRISSDDVDTKRSFPHESMSATQRSSRARYVAGLPCRLLSVWVL